MDRVSAIQGQFALLQDFANRNAAHVKGIANSPDWAQIVMNLDDVPLVVGGTQSPRVSRTHTLTFRFGASYPAAPPVFSVGPDRPIGAHVWRNGTVCLLQHHWYPARELWSGVTDLIESLQTGAQRMESVADQDNSKWLRSATNRNRLRALVGTPTRFRVPIGFGIVTVERPPIATVHAGSR